MVGKITAEILESYLNCKYKGYSKKAGEQGPLHDYEILMKESREKVGQVARERLYAQYGGEEIPDGIVLSTELLQRGLPLLLNVNFDDGELSVHIDALLRVNGDSPLGSFHHLPVLFHESEMVTAEVRMRLVIHGAILCDVQNKEPVSAILFHGRDCQRKKVKLSGSIAPARMLLQKISEAGKSPPRLLLNSHCQVCEFRQGCQAQAKTKDDLSLLRGMSEKEIQKYAKRGIFTVTQLSFTFRARKRLSNGRGKIIHQHALQALAIRENKVHVLGAVELPTSPTRI